MNTAETFVDDSHGALITALQSAKRARFMKASHRAPGETVPHRCSVVRLPVIHVPRLSWWQCTRLARLGFPDIQDMVAEMIDVSQNADDAVALAVDQIVQSSFAPELRNTLEMYFAFEGTPEIYDPMRVSQVYALYSYVTGPEAFADAVARIVPMTQDIKDMRARIAMS